MSEAEAALFNESEWQIGWRIALACAIGNGTGVSLLFLTFSMFLLPMSAELGLTRSETGLVQSMIVTAALGAPLVGLLLDTKGFRWVFTVCTLLMGLVQVIMTLWVTGLVTLALGVALTGLVGGGNSAVSLTRPINAHFARYRGTALGLMAAGVSITLIVVPPVLQMVIEDHGWRGGMLALAVISTLIGLPLVLALLPRETGKLARARTTIPAPVSWGFLKERDFQLLALANVVAGIATAGAISQLSPMVQARGFDGALAALGVSAFAAGQLGGKLVGGWLLDRHEPRLVAALLTVLPATGFLVFLVPGVPWPAILAAAALIGVIQGAELDIFAYFIGRRFPLGQYGTIYGALIGLGWIGNAIGILGFSVGHDLAGGYGPIQLAAIGFLACAALLILQVRLPSRP